MTPSRTIDAATQAKLDAITVIEEHLSWATSALKVAYEDAVALYGEPAVKQTYLGRRIATAQLAADSAFRECCAQQHYVREGED